MNVNFKEADKAIQSIAKVEGDRPRRNMQLGWYGAQMKAANEWTKYGFQGETEYRAKAGISVSIWGRYVRIASDFLHLPVEDFVKMSAENAEALGSLPLEKRNDFTWVFEAITLPAEPFKKKVLEAKATAAGVEPKDMRVKYSQPCFEAQRTVIKNGIKDFAREHQIKDDGTALEWLVMEYSQRKTFRKFLVDHLPLLRAAHHGDKESLGTYIQAMSEMLENLKG
jgi:hypothetical protein